MHVDLRRLHALATFAPLAGEAAEEIEQLRDLVGTQAANGRASRDASIADLAEEPGGGRGRTNRKQSVRTV